MFRQVVTFRWNAESSPEHVAALKDALSGLPGILPELRRYAFGSDAGINDGNYDFAVVGEFDNSADYLIYRDNEEHARIIKELIIPFLDSRTAVQFDFND
ncbi:MAG: Dabb family protein [Actinomycetes bacterium]